MKSLEVELPGGAWKNGRLLRKARFRPLNGEVELAICRSAGSDDVPARVSGILASALAGIGAEGVDEETVAGLCVADRQYLMLQLGRLLEGDIVWLTAHCEKCGGAFDFSLRRSELVARKAAQGFPFVALRLGGKEACFHVPTGADQAAVVAAEGDGRALLFERCLVAVDGEPPPIGFIDSLAESDRARIEELLEGVSPAVITGFLAGCPDCRHEQAVSFDPYAFQAVSQERLLREVHTLASTYHWGEQEIFALPRERRRYYLRLIDRSRGLCD